MKTTEDSSPVEATQEVYLMCDLGLALVRLLLKTCCGGEEALAPKIPGGCCMPQSFFKAAVHRRIGDFPLERAAVSVKGQSVECQERNAAGMREGITGDSIGQIAEMAHKISSITCRAMAWRCGKPFHDRTCHRVASAYHVGLGYWMSTWQGPALWSDL